MAGEDLKDKIKTPEQAAFVNSLKPEGEAKIIIEEKKPEDEGAKLETPEIDNEGHVVTPKTEITPAVEVITDTTPVIKIKSKQPENKAAKKEETAEDDIEDDKLLKALSKKLGKEFTSLDEIGATKQAEPTAEEINKQKEQREAAKLNFGLTKGLIAKKDYESFVVDMSDPLKVVYEDFKADQLAENKDLKESDIKDLFDETYNQDKDETTPEFKRGKKMIEREATEIIRNKHSKILSLENAFDAHEKGEKSRIESEQNILKQAPKFKQDVEEVRDSLKKLKITAGGKSYEIEVEPDVVNTYTSQMLTPEYSAKVIGKGWSKEEISTNLQNAIMLDNLDDIISGIVDKALLEKQAGTRGIQPVGKETRKRAVHNTVQEESLKTLEAQLGMTAN